MEARKLNELYQIILKRIELFGFQDRGICWVIGWCYISYEINKKEREIVRKHFANSKPSQDLYVSYFKDSTFNKSMKKDYWWQTSEAGNKQRINFLKTLIVSCKKKDI